MTAAFAPAFIFDELGAHVDALLQGRDEVLLRRDGLPQLVAFGGLLRPLGVERGDVRRQLSEIGGENPVLALAQRRRDAVRPVDRRRRIEAMRLRAQERGLAAQDFRPRGSKLRARAFRVGQGRRAVELDQHVARLHERAVADANGLDLAGFQRLDDLDLSRRLKLALRGGDDVDAAEIGPGEGGDDEGADDPQEGDMDRRRRRLQDLERGREEFPVAEIHSRSLEPRQRARAGERAGWRSAPGRRAGPRRSRGHAAISAGWL